MRLHDYFDFRREYPDTAFAVLGDRTMSYREASGEVNRLAHALIGAGLEPGDRIAMLSKNSIEYALMYYAASKAGVAPVPMNYRLAPPEWTYIINDAGGSSSSPAAYEESMAQGGDLKAAKRSCAWAAPLGRLAEVRCICRRTAVGAARTPCPPRR
jgi:acyl-CoA synthetase (AMP-forming)/AMP-acid ligase II